MECIPVTEDSTNEQLFTKMTDYHLSILSLNVNDLNTNVIDKWAELKTELMSVAYKRHLTTERSVENIRMAKIFQANGKEKQSGLAILRKYRL